MNELQEAAACICVDDNDEETMTLTEEQRTRFKAHLFEFVVMNVDRLSSPEDGCWKYQVAWHVTTHHYTTLHDRKETALLIAWLSYLSECDRIAVGAAYDPHAPVCGSDDR